MPPELSADPISPSAIERPLRPPNQQSQTRGGIQVRIAFHWNPLSLARLSLSSFHRPRRAEGAAIFRVLVRPLNPP